MKENIILDTLKKKLTQVQKKRDKQYNLMQNNHYSEICEIRQGFSNVVKEHGIISEEAIAYASKHADREQSLFKEAKYVNENHESILNDVIKYDRQIMELSNEIAIIEIRK